MKFGRPVRSHPRRAHKAMKKLSYKKRLTSLDYGSLSSPANLNANFKKFICHDSESDSEVRLGVSNVGKDPGNEVEL
jgi:hypothetical protein